jgi:hypothetical protein
MSADDEVVRNRMASLGWTTKNRALISAFAKGMEARAKGEPSTANPYSDVRNYRGMITFSRAFYRFWNRGWSNVNERR